MPRQKFNLTHVVHTGGWHQIQGTVDGVPVSPSEVAGYQGVTALRFLDTATGRDRTFVAITNYHDSAIGLRAGIVYEVTPIAHVEV